MYLLEWLIIMNWYLKMFKENFSSFVSYTGR